MNNREFSQKEHFDKKSIDSAFRNITKHKTKHKESENTEELKIHLVFASQYYLEIIPNSFYMTVKVEDRLISSILAGIKKYKINSVMVTIFFMRKRNIITKEAMEKYCKGEKYEKKSVNDDLKSFFEAIRLGKEPDEYVQTYFLPKLTEEEMELVERKDTSYFETYIEGAYGAKNPDVKAAEIKLSESDSKFARGYGVRKTFTIENPSSPSICNFCSLPEVMRRTLSTFVRRSLQ